MQNVKRFATLFCFLTDCDLFQNEDYFAAIRGGVLTFDENFGAMLRESRADSAKIQVAGAVVGAGQSQGSQLGQGDGELPKIPPGQPLANGLEQQLPPYPKNLTARDGEWQIVNGTR